MTLKKLIFTNKPGFTSLDIPSKSSSASTKQHVVGHDTVIIYRDKNVIINDKLYYIQVAKKYPNISVFGRLFFKYFLFTVFFGVVICLFSGLYLSSKVLKPIRNISIAVKELTSKSLEKRIPINGPDDELKELSIIFNSMIERLETDFKKQKRFVYDASHELRTPLSVIYGNINMLTRWGKSEPEILDKALLTLKSETENMNELITKLLYLAKSDSEAIELKKAEFTLNTLFKEVVDETLMVHSDYIVTYNCGEEDTLNADYNSIKQVLRIIVDNSIKFSLPPGYITIQAEIKNEGMGITVSDKGCGIPESELKLIFDRFYKVDESRTKATGGLGLGLSIAKQIIQNHNGTIVAKSKSGEGTKIEIVLPIIKG